MSFNFAGFKQKVKDVEEWLKREYAGVRTGRATPVLLDRVFVESYGSKMPIQQVAGITTEDARSLRVTPWDASQIKNIEKAVTVADLGVSVIADEKGLRIFFPELTSERRAALIKIAKEKLEGAKITLRQDRDRVWDEIQKKEKAKEIDEDEKFSLKKEMQKIVDDANKALDDIAARKEKEITS
ncbi:ribosome recycling factor [Candidatus Parcubacteria bacterium]|nr:ribosome recycling factor [Candidatus Parcubacteria bacterium]